MMITVATTYWTCTTCQVLCMFISSLLNKAKRNGLLPWSFLVENCAQIGSLAQVHTAIEYCSWASKPCSTWFQSLSPPPAPPNFWSRFRLSLWHHSLRSQLISFIFLLPCDIATKCLLWVQHVVLVYKLRCQRESVLQRECWDSQVTLKREKQISKILHPGDTN